MGRVQHPEMLDGAGTVSGDADGMDAPGPPHISSAHICTLHKSNFPAINLQNRATLYHIHANQSQ